MIFVKLICFHLFSTILPQTTFRQHLTHPQYGNPYQQPSSQLGAQQHQQKGVALPIASAGTSHTVNENTIVMLDGRASYSQNSGGKIIAYQ